MNKKLIWVIGSSLLVIIFLLWFVNKRNNEKQLNLDLAVRFDRTMEACYPFLSKIAESSYYKTDFIEKNAIYAYNNYPYDFVASFKQLNLKSWDSDGGKNVSYWLSKYSFFTACASYGHIEGHGNLREKEYEAFQKLIYASSCPNNIYEIDYDSLIYQCKLNKLRISEAMKDIDKYRNTKYDVDSWRWVDPLQYSYIYDRYYKNINWPFNLFKICTINK